MAFKLEAGLRHFRATHTVAGAHFAGASWSYVACGQGHDTLLLLPGAPGIAEMAFPYIMALEPHYRVIAPSYPATVGSLAQLLAGLEALLDAESDGPVHMIGASYSGMVAQYLLRRRPEHFRTLLIGDTGVPRKERARVMRPLLAALSSLPLLGLHAFLYMALANVLGGSTGSHRFWQRYFKGVVAALTVDEFTNRVRVLIEMDECEDRFGPPVVWRRPTLLMETVKDPLFSAAERAALRERYPQAEVYRFHSFGHITALTRAPEYIAAMAHFLERHATGAPPLRARA